MVIEENVKVERGGVFIVTPNAMIKLEVILYLKWFRNFYHRDSYPTFVSANFYHDFYLTIFKYD